MTIVPIQQTGITGRRPAVPGYQRPLIDWKSATIEERRQYVRAQGMDLAWVEIPVDLETFLYSKAYLGHPRLSALQLDAVHKGGELFDVEAAADDPSQARFMPTQYIEHVYLWGKGCVAGETRIQNARTGEVRTAKEWAEMGESLTVWALDGEQVVQIGTDGPVFLRGHGKLLRVRTVGGETIEVYVAHQFLIERDGEPRWARAGELRLGVRLRMVRDRQPCWDRVVSIEPIGEGDYYDLTVPGLENYAAEGFWNHNSGKDTVAMLIMARALYLLGCLTSPQRVFGMPEYASIDLLNIAVSGDQAEGNFFNPLCRLLNRSDWFTYKMETRIKDTLICLPPIIGHNRELGDMHAVNCWSGTSSESAMEGKNLLIGIADEIDAFRDAWRSGNRNVMATSATSMYDMLTTSVQSRFPGIGRVILLSWPRYFGSFIMRRAEEGRNDPQVYVSGPYAVWEVNPTKQESDFDHEFRRNPERARAKYMAQPAQAFEAYYSNQVAVLRAFHAQKAEGDAFVIERSEDDPGPEPPVNEYGVLNPARLEPPQRGMVYCIHGDLAKTGDRAAIAMAHHSGFVADEEGELDLLPQVTLDFVAWWQGEPGREIDLAVIRRFILDLARMGYRLASVTFDSYASDEMIQRLSKYDQWGRRLQYRSDGSPLRDAIEAGYYSLDTSTRGHDTMKSLVYEPNRLIAYYDPLLIEEVLGLMYVSRGKKVDHPADGSKDCIDAAAGAVVHALQHLNDRRALGIGRTRGFAKATVNRKYGSRLTVHETGKKRPRGFA